MAAGDPKFEAIAYAGNLRVDSGLNKSTISVCDLELSTDQAENLAALIHDRYLMVKIKIEVNERLPVH